MHEKNIEFIVAYCKGTCKDWAHCIRTSKGYDNGDKEEKRSLLFCLKTVEHSLQGEEVGEEQIEKEVSIMLGDN